MKILVIGSGGREHALCWKISQSPKVDQIFCAPGNGGTKDIAENVDINPDQIERLADFAKKEKIDLTIVGPELPLVLGIVDKFHENKLKIFGVNKKSARLEGSKDFSKRFMEKYNIPTAKYKTYTELDQAIDGIKEFTYPLVIKADGLCAGKGVVICESEGEAQETLKEILENRVFGDEGGKVIVEEFLDGIETSLICIVTEDKIIPMESAMDHKKIYDGDKGPNTGGVGAYSPSSIIDRELKEKVEEDILRKIIYGLEEENLNFKGILFIGLMIVDGNPMVLEFNTRFGDPETQVLMPRLESDIIDIFEKTIEGTLLASDLKWTEESSMTVILTSKGYPGEFEKGKIISGIENLDEEIILFHNGTAVKNHELVTNGGRVLSVTSLGSVLNQTSKTIYKNIEKMSFEGMYFRKDIGKK